MPGLRLRLYQDQSANQIIKLRPLCNIVYLLESKGNFDKEHVKEAFLDYQNKHGMSLNDRVSALFKPKSLTSPSRHAAYWKKVNPNTIKIAAWGLEEEVSKDYPDALEAAGTITENFLKQYNESLSFISKKMLERSNSANEVYKKSKEHYSTIKNSWIDNKTYLESNFPAIFTEKIGNLIKNIDSEIKNIEENKEKTELNISGRKKQIRNLYSYLTRRKKVKNGGYHESSICSGCGRAVTEDNELCRDCKK